MIGFIIWIIGVILTIRAAMEIWRWRGIATEKRLVAIILVILTSSDRLGRILLLGQG